MQTQRSESSQHPGDSQGEFSRIHRLQQIKEAEPSETEEASFQIVIVSLDNEFYGMRILSVREILRVTRITWLPCTPEYLVGVISLRGDIHAVVDVKYFLHAVWNEVTDHSRIIVVESGDLVAGLLVDEMVDILDVPESHLLPVTESSLSMEQSALEGKVSWNDQMVTLLNINEILRDVVVDQS